MKLHGKMIFFLFILIRGFILYADNSPAEDPPDEDSMLENWVLFFNRYLNSDDESPSDDDLFLSDEDPYDEDPLLSEEDPYDDDPLLSDENPYDDDPLLSDETPSDEDPLLSDETPYDEDPLLSDENPSDDEQIASVETLPDEDDYLFYEAPDLIIEVPKFEERSIDDVFPGLSQWQRIMAMSDEGLRNYFTRDEPPAFIPNPDTEIDLMGAVINKNPSHIIEALIVVPYHNKEFDLLDIYNALGRVEKIKDCTISLGDSEYYIFTESTRIESRRNLREIPDPLPAQNLPFSDTMYLRLKEIHFGNLYIRGEINISVYGLTYNMTNFRDVRYFLIPIIRAERYTTIIYLEPVKEGILIYSMSGFYMPGFIAERVNLTPSINNRITIILNWITEGLREQENAELIQEEM